MNAPNFEIEIQKILLPKLKRLFKLKYQPNLSFGINTLEI